MRLGRQVAKTLSKSAKFKIEVISIYMDNYFDLVVPDCAVKYILLQRTELQKYFRILKKNRFLYYTCFISLEAYLMRQKIKENFALKLFEEYQTLKPYIPTQASRIVDIGSGRLILDVRKGSDGENALKQKFLENYLIMQDEKRRRLLLIK